MATDINLIRSVLEAKKEKRQKKSKSSFLVLICIVAVLFITGLVLGARILISQKGNSLDRQINDLNQTLKDTEELEKQTKSLNSDTAKINSVLKTASNWPTILGKVAAATPTNLQITKLEYTGKSVATTTAAKTSAQKIQYKIYGTTLDQRSVALFQEKLAQYTDIFTAVDIVNSEKTTTAAEQTTGQVITFQIDATLKETGKQ